MNKFKAKLKENKKKNEILMSYYESLLRKKHLDP